jgi:hypothetical protein
VLLREADGSTGGIWRVRLRRWCEASRYVESVVSLLEGCDLSSKEAKRTHEFVRRD